MKLLGGRVRSGNGALTNGLKHAVMELILQPEDPLLRNKHMSRIPLVRSRNNRAARHFKSANDVPRRNVARRVRSPRVDKVHPPFGLLSSRALQFSNLGTMRGDDSMQKADERLVRDEILRRYLVALCQ